MNVTQRATGRLQRPYLRRIDFARLRSLKHFDEVIGLPVRATRRSSIGGICCREAIRRLSFMLASGLVRQALRIGIGNGQT